MFSTACLSRACLAADVARVWHNRLQVPVALIMLEAHSCTACGLQVKPETALVRPFVVAAVLRGISFDATRYKSFIDLQVRADMGMSCSRSPMKLNKHISSVCGCKDCTILCDATRRRSCTRTCVDSAVWCLWARTTWRR